MFNNQNVEQRIVDAFERNFDYLQLESGHSITADIKRTALNQVLLYWRKLKDLILRVTETEVRLILPNNQSPSGRVFNIEGVVDIVQGAETTIMYDIKTRTAEEVQANIEEYEKQLNVYAFIWKVLRDQPLDKTAIIATAYPEEVKNALKERDHNQLAQSLENWNPLVETNLNEKDIDEVILQFGEVVDLIEDHRFEPHDVHYLIRPYGSTQKPFGYVVCRNCDGRFSCNSYRAYIKNQSLKGESMVDQINDSLEQEAFDEWVESEFEEIEAI